MAGNETLSARNRAALDEWYTQLTDIEAELRHYRDQFKGKVVFCNCDDPYESNFFKFFAMSFNHLGLKRLITTCYAGSPISGEQLPLLETAGLRDTQPPREPYKVVISEVPDLNEDGAIDLADVEYLLRNDANAMTPLKGDGDFRSKECVALLDQADIVVTNPPFSLFREYINLLTDHGKQFLVLGDQNGAKYSSIFPHIVANRLWFGYENGGTKWFRVPDDYEIKTASRKMPPGAGDRLRRRARARRVGTDPRRCQVPEYGPDLLVHQPRNNQAARTPDAVQALHSGGVPHVHQLPGHRGAQGG